MAGLSSAYLFSKVIVLSLIAVMQSALVTLVGLAGQKVVIPGTALIEIFVALAVLSVTSMMIGLAISRWSPRATRSCRSSSASPWSRSLSGGLFPLVGTLGDVALIDARALGLGAVATIGFLPRSRRRRSRDPTARSPRPVDA